MSARTIWLSCGVLRDEMEALHRQGKIAGRLLFLDSMLHMAPQKLETMLTIALEQAAPKRETLDAPASDTACNLVLVYGDCCARMLDLVKRFRVRRVRAINCAQLLLGHARYRELMREQAFLLVPEWVPRWGEVMRIELGLSKAVAHDLMREHRRMLIYLDTGHARVPRQTLEECSAYAGLPWRVETVTLDYLLAGLREAEEAQPPAPWEEQP